MKKAIKVTRIGNSRGIRLKKSLLERYGIEDTLILEETADAIVLRKPPGQEKTWEQTYREMAAAKEDWADWEAMADEGLGDDD
jgi:antitoxin MazE